MNQVVYRLKLGRLCEEAIDGSATQVRASRRSRIVNRDLYGEMSDDNAL
jgi:hypothetical protein